MTDGKLEADFVEALAPLEKICAGSIGLFGRPIVLAKKSPRQINVTKVNFNPEAAKKTRSDLFFPFRTARKS